MKQLILPEEYNMEEVYSLPKAESHYLIKVQRKQVGFSFNLIDCKGNKYLGQIEDTKDENQKISMRTPMPKKLIRNKARYNSSGKCI